MWKTFKWAYELGQTQERQRIKLEISKIQVEIANRSREIRLNIRDSDTIPEKHELLAKDLAVTDQVNEIIGHLTRPFGQWVEEGTAPIDGSK